MSRRGGIKTEYEINSNAYDASNVVRGTSRYPRKIRRERQKAAKPVIMYKMLKKVGIRCVEGGGVTEAQQRCAERVP